MEREKMDEQVFSFCVKKNLLYECGTTHFQPYFDVSLFLTFFSFSSTIKAIRWRKPQKGSPVQIRRSPRYCKADEIHTCHWETGKAWKVG